MASGSLRSDRWSSWGRRIRPGELLACMLAAALIALAARIRIETFPGAVPITGQSLGVIITGATLGARRGAGAAALYLGAVLAGAPILAGGRVGPEVLAGPTGGYLIGFLPAAWIAGRAAERGMDRRFLTAMAAYTLAHGIVLTLGVARLTIATDALTAWRTGAAPLFAGAALKSVLLAAVVSAVRRFSARTTPRAS